MIPDELYVVIRKVDGEIIGTHTSWWSAHSHAEDDSGDKSQVVQRYHIVRCSSPEEM